MKRTKMINRSRIMREIWINRETSRVEIARSLGLDKSTISHAVNELIEKGVIIESSEGSSGPQGGRRPVHIKLNREYGAVLGVEFRPDSYTAVAVDLEGDIIYSRFERIAIAGEKFTSVVIEILHMLIDELERKEVNLLGIGVGLSGVVNAQNGTIRYSEPFGIVSTFDFFTNIASLFDIPLFVDNDANACVWGELAFHRRKDLKDFIFLLLEFREPGTNEDRDCTKIGKIGVGIGIVINGNVHYGHQYAAGEFRSLFRTENSVGQFSLTSDEHRRIFDDDAVMNKFLHELGAHVGLLVNVFNMSHIILGGAFDELGPRVKDIFEQEIKKSWPYPYTPDIKKSIWYSSFADRAVAYGAAGMVLNTLFSDLEVMEGTSLMLNLREGLVVF
ncbi:ROK family transcriptional regulator [Sediminispirochaeta bajacaliforniensis]|uniref:ROK family transcriptional regulator n=1 Tax=Sediminispirochaeta bajacaliforniensis TaxID=148 RepID=UPI0003A92A29|nr:ROK family transcriptional regulator [Sediminispirochaeta bajacaliforniensis]